MNETQRVIAERDNVLIKLRETEHALLKATTELEASKNIARKQGMMCVAFFSVTALHHCIHLIRICYHRSGDTGTDCSDR